MRAFRVAVVALGAGAVVSAESLRLGIAGDVMLSYEMGPWLERFGPKRFFGGVEPLLRRFDLFVVNLECPITDGGLPLQNKRYRFRSEPWAVAGLVFAGVGLVSLANNHVMDFGDVGLFRTREVLEAAGIAWVGAGRDRAEAWRPRVLDRKGVRVAFLAFNQVGPEVFAAADGRPGVAVCDEASLVEAVREAKRLADHVVVLFHWGGEYAPEPDGVQRRLGRRAVEAGASVVAGCHPHVVQAVEVRQGRPIAYSLGNFVFGSWGRPPERTADAGLVLDVVLESGGGVGEVRVWAVNVFNHEVRFRPRLLVGEAGVKVLRRVVAGDGWSVSAEGSAEWRGKN